jgi:hypothetical protein
MAYSRSSSGMQSNVVNPDWGWYWPPINMVIFLGWFMGLGFATLIIQDICNDFYKPLISWRFISPMNMVKLVFSLVFSNISSSIILCCILWICVNTIQIHIFLGNLHLFKPPIWCSPKLQVFDPPPPSGQSAAGLFSHIAVSTRRKSPWGPAQDDDPSMISWDFNRILMRSSWQFNYILLGF